MAAERRHPATSRLVAVVLMSFVGFGVNLYVATALDERHAYEDWETVFSSDPNWYLLRLTDGTYSSRRHPLVHVFMDLPARAVASAVSAVTAADERALRRQLVILATPIASGIKTAVLLAFCTALGLGLRHAILIALIDIASLSRLIFGSVPESFGATALAMVWILYLAARARRDDPAAALPLASWFACGVFAVGVTITNGVPYAVLLGAVLIARTGAWRRPLLRAAGMACLAVVTVAAIHAASQVFVQPEPPPGPPPPSSGATASPARPQTPEVLRNISPFVRFAPFIKLQQFPASTAASFLAPPPVPYPVPPRDRPHARTRLFLPTRQFTGRWLACMGMVFGVLGMALYGVRRAPARLIPLAWGIGAVLVFNLALFTLWGGGNVFLFTLHWQPFLIALLALAGTATARIARGVIAANALLLVAEVVWNVRFLQSAFAAL